MISLLSPNPGYTIAYLSFPSPFISFHINSRCRSEKKACNGRKGNANGRKCRTTFDIRVKSWRQSQCNPPRHCNFVNINSKVTRQSEKKQRDNLKARRALVHVHDRRCCSSSSFSHGNDDDNDKMLEVPGIPVVLERRSAASGGEIYANTVLHTASWNTRLRLERNQRLPFLDSQVIDKWLINCKIYAITVDSVDMSFTPPPGTHDSLERNPSLFYQREKRRRCVYEDVGGATAR